MKWSNLTIGKRIATGFGVILALLGIVAVLSYSGVGSIVNNASQVIDGNKLDGLLAQKEVDHLNWVGKVNALLTDDKITKLQVQTDDHKCGFGKWLYGQDREEAERLVPALASLLKEIENPHLKLHETAIAIGKVYKQANAKLPVLMVEREVDHLKWAAKIRDAFLQKKDSLGVQTDPAKCALGKWLTSGEAKNAYTNGSADFKKFWDELLVSHAKLHKSAIDIEHNLVTFPQVAKKIFDETTIPILHETLALLRQLKVESEHELAGMKKAQEIYAIQTVPALETVQGILHKVREKARESIMTDEVMLSSAQGTKRNVSIISVVAIVIGIFLAFFISKGIISALKRISDQMGEGADQVASASGQVSSSSQQLAEGASEQAASLEETSSSLEEMASMTKQNADNAGQANSLMKEANGVVNEATEAMSEVITSMEEITKASEETSKIIKTIDEIAFQTNLLALNAAVEAARAGEAGAGFAVVADEVRNLALKAKDAAQSTSDLIEGTIKQVKNGSEMVTRTNEAFTKVVDSSGKAAELVGEIAAASLEQSQGIEQVNTAMNQMDKVVQSSAATAEESASASEELNAQAENMRENAGDLQRLVGGASESDNGGSYDSRAVRPKAPQPRRVSVAKALTMPKKDKGLEINPEEEFPMDDDF